MGPIAAGTQGLLLGFGAGVMLAASVFSLLVPGFAAATALGLGPAGAALVVVSGTRDAVATGIPLQNVPEGLIVAIALVTAGYGRFAAFAVATLSGLVEPLAALAGSLMVAQAEAL